MNRSSSEFDSNEFERLLDEAFAGSTCAVEKLLQSCRSYLLLISNQELDTNIQGKLGASDIVQETMLTAQRDFRTFRGQSRAELLSWLRGILANDLRDARRRFRTDKREVTRERPMAGDSLAERHPIDLSDARRTPSAQAMADEEAAALHHAIQRLPPDYRRVIQLRTWEQFSFDEVGSRMNRSAEAARKLWARAIVQLQSELSK